MSVIWNPIHSFIFIHLFIRPSIRSSVRRSDGRTVSWSVSGSLVGQSVGLSVCLFFCQWVSQSIRQSVSEWGSQSVSQSVSFWVGLFVSEFVYLFVLSFVSLFLRSFVHSFVRSCIHFICWRTTACFPFLIRVVYTFPSERLGFSRQQKNPALLCNTNVRDSTTQHMVDGWFTVFSYVPCFILLSLIHSKAYTMRLIYLSYLISRISLSPGTNIYMSLISPIPSLPEFLSLWLSLLSRAQTCQTHSSFYTGRFTLEASQFLMFPLK